MKVCSRVLMALTVMTIVGGASCIPAFAADGYGSVKGRFVYDGEVPEKMLQRSKGDASIKDAAVCAAENHFANDLVVNPENKGIANVFVYMRSADEIHPDLKESEEKQVVFDQKGCTFKPHAMFIRTDQTVIVKSDDAVAHNTHTFPLRNQAVNFLLRPNDREGVPVTQNVSEILPIKVTCDIHPWMTAYWLILDHPYAAVTNEDGSFEISNLPAGRHSFRVWQEKAGYLDRSLSVTIKDGEVTDLGDIEVSPRKLD